MVQRREENLNETLVPYNNNGTFVKFIMNSIKVVLMTNLLHCFGILVSSYEFGHGSCKFPLI